MTDRGPRGDQGERGPRGEQGEGWQNVGFHVMQELNRLSDAIERMDSQNRTDHAMVVAEIAAVKSEISALKVKAGFYGALAGLGAAVSVFMAQIFGAGGGHA